MAGQKGERADKQAWDHHVSEPEGASNRIRGRTGLTRVPQGVGARTPEELEALLEDTVVMREREALTELFEETAVLVVNDAASARGHEAIGRLALEAWRDGRPYLAGPQLVVQARDVALIVTDHGANVARRGRDGTWRYTIVADTGENRPKGARK